jgi:hypothetical protein
MQFRSPPAAPFGLGEAGVQQIQPQRMAMFFMLVLGMVVPILTGRCLLALAFGWVTTLLGTSQAVRTVHPMAFVVHAGVERRPTLPGAGRHAPVRRRWRADLRRGEGA